MAGLTALYRAYEANGNLLYVGISTCAITRFREHKRSSDWSSMCSDLKIEWHPDRNAAELAERDAIMRECPAFNVVHNHQSARPMKFLTREEQLEEDDQLLDDEAEERLVCDLASGRLLSLLATGKQDDL